jgi:hypothetical protein
MTPRAKVGQLCWSARNRGRSAGRACRRGEVHVACNSWQDDIDQTTERLQPVLLLGLLSRLPALSLTRTRPSGPSEPAWARNLPSYRRQMQTVWSEKTMHESFRPRPGQDVPSSRGQCGVSSAWLMETLNRQGVKRLTYCYGNVYSATERGVVELERHCWVEVGWRRNPARFVIDLTGDQAPVLKDHPVLFRRYRAVKKDLRVEYRAATRMSLPKLAEDPVQDRLDILKDSLLASD